MVSGGSLVFSHSPLAPKTTSRKCFRLPCGPETVSPGEVRPQVPELCVAQTGLKLVILLASPPSSNPTSNFHAESEDTLQNTRAYLQTVYMIRDLHLKCISISYKSMRQIIQDKSWQGILKDVFPKKIHKNTREDVQHAITRETTKKKY